MVSTSEPAQVDGKRKIKKLTAEKLAQFQAEISKGDGRQIDLTGRGIETIVSLDGLQRATKLDLSHNKLTKLSQLRTVLQTTMLKLTDNKLNGDGLAEVQHLKKLVVLNVADNQVSRIPVEVLRNLRNLKGLVLNNNSISTLDWLPKLPELNSLIVSNNRISQIPQRVVEGFPSLTKISISHNLLEEIPDLSQLTEITELRLSHNRIKKLPAHLARLKNLKVLELSHNQIDDWEGLEALSSLENLRQLNLTGNPIVGEKLDGTKKTEEEDSDDSSDDNSDDGGSDSDAEEEKKKKKSASKKNGGSAEDKEKIKAAKRLVAKNKMYNFKMKRLFPNLIVRDGQRVMDKRVHGYVAPPKEEKKEKHKKPEPSAKKKSKAETGKRKRDEHKKPKSKKEPSESTADSKVDSIVEKPAKKAKTSDKKKHKTETKEEAEPIATTEKKSKHKKQSKSEEPADNEDKHVLSVKEDKVKEKTEKTKEKKRKDKEQDKKKDKRQPKEIASGVVAVKQFKKSKKSKTAASKPVDLTQLNFTPDQVLKIERCVKAHEELHSIKAKMASNPVSEFVSKLMAPKYQSEEDTVAHLSTVAEGAKWRLHDDLPAQRKAGFHRHHQHTSPEGFPEVPRQYIVPSHSKEQNFATYAANSYSSAIAIQEEMKKRPF
ncbi:Leucine-rich repeat-containing protein 9 [Phytophthora boehmeriae]|uniref:Leucine-rich repeat-containing protein 9 n=1 Tax=Phytophthora boehmeriae TaxID=109152 RepID=A0A8T1X6X8_9STRA|nr:Leucine-rich repeat-containing protein 9 [Phytophthora boehmeriae]